MRDVRLRRSPAPPAASATPLHRLPTGQATAPSRRPAARGRDPNLDHPAVRACRERCKLTPNETQHAEIAVAVRDMPRWEEVLERWLLAGYRKNNVAGMLDWYRGRIPDRSPGCGNNGGG